MASGFVKIAMDEFYSHNPNNLTGLVQRYWMIVEDELAGNFFNFYFIARLFLKKSVVYHYNANIHSKAVVYLHFFFKQQHRSRKSSAFKDLQNQMALSTKYKSLNDLVKQTF